LRAVKEMKNIAINSRWDELTPENQLAVIRLVNSIASHSNPSLEVSRNKKGTTLKARIKCK